MPGRGGAAEAEGALRMLGAAVCAWQPRVKRSPGGGEEPGRSQASAAGFAPV